MVISNCSLFVSVLLDAKILIICSYSGRRAISASHADTTASLGIRQSPRGDRLILLTFGPSGMQLRLNCCEKNRL